MSDLRLFRADERGATMKAQAGPGSRNAKSRLTERHGPGSGLANQQPGGWEGGYSRNGSLTTKTRHVSLSKTDERSDG